ncbi:hypothetical protein PGB90_005185 [Kerria lacca]
MVNNGTVSCKKRLADSSETEVLVLPDIFQIESFPSVIEPENLNAKRRRYIVENGRTSDLQGSRQERAPQPFAEAQARSAAFQRKQTPTNKPGQSRHLTLCPSQESERAGGEEERKAGQTGVHITNSGLGDRSDTAVNHQKHEHAHEEE